MQDDESGLDVRKYTEGMGAGWVSLEGELISHEPYG